MTGFDIIVLLIVGVGAAAGFMRGFVQEVLSLASWALAVFAICFLHTDLTMALYNWIGTLSGASVMSFELLLLIPIDGMKLVAGWAGLTTRNSMHGPFDRDLGFGIGAVKGVIIVDMA